MKLQIIYPKILGWSLMLLVALTAAAAAQEPDPEPSPDPQPQSQPAPVKPTPVEQWLAKIQTLGAEYPKGQTQAMTDLRLKKFGQAIAEKFDGSYIEFHAKVRDVRWRDGIAEIDTISEFSEQRTVGRIKITGANQSVKLSRSAPIHLRMDQETAANILPDTLVTFRGRVTFHPANVSSARPTGESQHLYTLSHSALGGNNVGLFTSNDYTGTIDGQIFPGRWQPMPEKSP
jgi:hypothetical protein